MNIDRFKKIAGYVLLFAFAAVLIFGIIFAANFTLDGFWPWESYPEVQQ